MVSMATINVTLEHGGVHTKIGYISAITDPRSLNLVSFQSLNIALSSYGKISNLHIHEFMKTLKNDRKIIKNP